MSSQFFSVEEHLVPGQHIREYARGTSKNQNDALYLSVKHYTPKVQSGPLHDAVTIIAAHANGFPKELYEPFWDEMLQRTKGKFVIRGIWIADIANQGDSYIVNEGRVGNEISWFDHSRDLLHIINHFGPQMPRPLVGIGHSFGATQLMNISFFHPRLFSAFVLMDPILDPGIAPYDGKSKSGAARFGVARMSTFRRDIWPSREAARTTFLKSSFYRAWDPRVFDRWITHGLRDLPTAVYPEAPEELLKQTKQEQPSDRTQVPVTLKTTKHQEVWTFMRPAYSLEGPNGENNWTRKAAPDTGPFSTGSPPSKNAAPMYRYEPQNAFKRLPGLRPPSLYLLGGDSNISAKETQRDKVKVTGIGVGGSGGIVEGQVADVIMEGVGHLIPMEAPGKAAQHASDWLGKAYAKWKKDEDEYRVEEKRRPQRDYEVVDGEWLNVMSGKKYEKMSKLPATLAPQPTGLAPRSRSPSDLPLRLAPSPTAPPFSPPSFSTHRESIASNRRSRISISRSSAYVAAEPDSVTGQCTEPQWPGQQLSGATARLGLRTAARLGLSASGGFQPRHALHPPYYAVSQPYYRAWQQLLGQAPSGFGQAPQLPKRTACGSGQASPSLGQTSQPSGQILQSPTLASLSPGHALLEFERPSQGSEASQPPSQAAPQAQSQCHHGHGPDRPCRYLSAAASSRLAAAHGSASNSSASARYAPPAPAPHLPPSLRIGSGSSADTIWTAPALSLHARRPRGFNLSVTHAFTRMFGRPQAQIEHITYAVTPNAAGGPFGPPAQVAVEVSAWSADSSIAAADGASSFETAAEHAPRSDDSAYQSAYGIVGPRSTPRGTTGASEGESSPAASSPRSFFGSASAINLDGPSSPTDAEGMRRMLSEVSLAEREIRERNLAGPQQDPQQRLQLDRYNLNALASAALGGAGRSQEITRLHTPADAALSEAAAHRNTTSRLQLDHRNLNVLASAALGDAGRSRDTTALQILADTALADAELTAQYPGYAELVDEALARAAALPSPYATPPAPAQGDTTALRVLADTALADAELTAQYPGYAELVDEALAIAANRPSPYAAPASAARIEDLRREYNVLHGETLELLSQAAGHAGQASRHGWDGGEMSISSRRDPDGSYDADMEDNGESSGESNGESNGEVTGEADPRVFVYSNARQHGPPPPPSGGNPLVETQALFPELDFSEMPLLMPLHASDPAAPLQHSVPESPERS